MLNLVGPQQATESYRIYDGSFDLYFFFPHALGDLKKKKVYTGNKQIGFSAK